MISPSTTPAHGFESLSEWDLYISQSDQLAALIDSGEVDLAAGEAFEKFHGTIVNPSLPRPSGPSPWASEEEELEALYAEQAGEVPHV